MKTISALAFACLPLLACGQVVLTNDATVAIQDGATLFVTGAVQNTVGSTLTNAGMLQLTGDLTNAGSLTSNGVLLFGGTTDQTFTPGTATITTLTLNNTGAGSSNRLFIPANLTVTGTLTLTKGLLRTQGSSASSPLATLSLPDGGRVVGEGAGQYVQGRLAVTRATINASAVDFTNGAVLNSNGQDLGPVTITRTAGLQTAGVSYGTNVGGTNKGIDRVWQVAATQQPSATSPSTVTLSWVSDDDNDFNSATPAQLWRADQAAGPWAPQGAPASTSARSFTANVTQFGTLTVSNTSAPLPVTLVDFTAQRQGPDGLLRWTTASELHNDHFVVESSVDGSSFQALGQVAGHGTTSQAQQYQFTDAHLARYAADVVYYRLRQVDTDGTDTYSAVRTVQVPATGFAVEAFPTSLPSGQVLNIRVRTTVAGSATLLMTDALGRVIMQQALNLSTGASTFSLSAVTQWPQGIYLVRVQQGEQWQTAKFMRE
jgi:hypothetical protein